MITRPARSPRRRFFSLTLIEPLESRTLLSTITWNSTDHPAGGDWDTASNWVGGILPGSSDDVIITLAATATVTHSQSLSDSVHSITTNALTTLTISSGSLSVAATSTLAGPLDLSGGTLTGPGDLTIAGMMTWTGGSLTGSGNTVIAAGAALDITGGSVTAGRAIDSTAGPINWTGGTIGGTLDDTGALNISGSSGKDLSGGTINQAGTTTWTGTGGLALDYAGLFNNLVGSTFDDQTDSTIARADGTPGTFANAGTFKKSAGTGTTTFGAAYPVAFNNSGVVQVQSGTLSLAGGTQTGTFDVAAGCTLGFDGGTTDLDAGVTFPGAGAIRIGGGTTNLNTPLSLAALNVSGGTANLAVASFANLTLSDGTLTGPGDLTIAGTMTWTGGSLTGSGNTVIAAGAALDITGGNVTAGRAIDSTAGPINWTGGRSTARSTTRAR